MLSFTNAGINNNEILISNSNPIINSEPGKPTNIVATYINYRYTELTWDAPVNTGGFNITSYKYKVSVDSGDAYEVDINLTSPVTSPNLSGYHQHSGFATGSYC